MPTEVLNQLRTLREGIAETLRKDPRYLTLAALDKSIAEISGVLSASGLLPADTPPPAPVHFDVPPTAPAEPAKPKASAAKPVAEAAAVLVAGGVAAEALHAKGNAAAPAPEPATPAAEKDEESEPTDEDPAEHEPEAEDGEESAEAADGHEADGHADGHESADDAHDGDESEVKAESAEAAPDGEDKHDQADTVIPQGKASGYKAMAAKPGAPQYQPAIAVKFGKLPNKVDLRPLMTPVEDQGQTSSCVANAVAGAYEYWIKKASKQDHNISRLFVYYNARWRDGSQDKDEGSVIQLAMEGLSKFGACPETVWPFDPHLILKKPGAEAYKDGAPYKVQDMAQVPLKLEAWKQALAEGKPIVFGCELFDSFDECTQKGGVVPMPAPDDIARKKHSGHSMCAVGYSDTEKVFIVRNSWGTDFGDKGYCYMPYAYLMSPKFNDGDCWVFVPKVPMQPPRETWIDNTDPVTNDGKGVDFKIETYTIEDYSKVAVDLFEHARRPFNTFIEGGYSEYITLAEKSLYSQMEQFDFRTFLASTAALAGVAIVAESLYSERTSSETSSAETLSAMSQESEETESEDEADGEGDETEDGDDEAEDGDDEAEDGDGETEDGDDDAEDGDGETEDGDDDAEDGDGETEDGDDEAEDGDGETEDGDDEAEDGDGETEDGDDEAEDGDGETEDGDDEEAEGDEAEDDAGGDDDGGGDDSGGDDE
jgi:C1A family cysteine protease